MHDMLRAAADPLSLEELRLRLADAVVVLVDIAGQIHTVPADSRVKQVIIANSFNTDR